MAFDELGLLRDLLHVDEDEFAYHFMRVKFEQHGILEVWDEYNALLDGFASEKSLNPEQIVEQLTRVLEIAAVLQEKLSVIREENEQTASALGYLILKHASCPVTRHQ